MNQYAIKFFSGEKEMADVVVKSATARQAYAEMFEVNGFAQYESHTYEFVSGNEFVVLMKDHVSMIRVIRADHRELDNNQ